MPSQEKVKKIVDIWAKAGTFEGRMIKELQEMVARHAAGPDTVIASKEVESSQRSTTPTGDPRHSSYYSLFQQGGSQAQDDVGGGANHAQPVAPTQASLIPQNILALLESASSTSSAAASASTVASPGQPSAATPQARPQADQPGPSQAPVDFMSSLASMLGQATSGNQSQM
ncbi:hypothetical protein IE53DRAFT_231133 [Violaceomyces palustris]|uniref:Uncharacterized protein n=1 Tax=Violaceomyces palustris TaxID=1673888 RepID=A0ACD0NPN8_9BASI|nr:hypothetical protein IE53DRAFT_231133 [Violaceomyces palustris]